MNIYSNKDSVILFPTCQSGCVSNIRPGEFTLSNNITIPVWECRGCGSTLITILARKVINRRLICRYEYEEAARVVLKEDTDEH